MSKFYQLLRPAEFRDKHNIRVYRVEAVSDDNAELYLHCDGNVKDSYWAWDTTPDFLTLNGSYWALNSYYAAHGQIAPYEYRHGKWLVVGNFSYGQTTPDVVYSCESETMVFK